MERDWVHELEADLQNRFAQLSRIISSRAPLSGVRIVPPLAREEAKYFLLGLENGLFQLDPEGYVESELFPPRGEAEGEAQMCQIFWSHPPRLFRESICQLATASALILKRGWPRNQVRLEPSIEEQASAAAGVDVLVLTGAGEVLIAVEVKRNAAELQKLLMDLQACSRRGSHAEVDCGFPQNHPKYEFCLSHQPRYFWAVAPEAEACFKMKYADGAIAPELLTSLPPRSLIELEAV